MKHTKDIEDQSYQTINESNIYDYCWPDHGICNVILPMLKATAKHLVLPTIVGLITFNTGVGQLAKQSGSAFAVGAGITGGILQLGFLCQATNHCIDRQGTSSSIDKQARKAWACFLVSQISTPIAVGLMTYLTGLPNIGQHTATAFGVGAAIGIAANQALNCMYDSRASYLRQ